MAAQVEGPEHGEGQRQRTSTLASTIPKASSVAKAGALILAVTPCRPTMEVSAPITTMIAAMGMPTSGAIRRMSTKTAMRGQYPKPNPRACRSLPTALDCGHSCGRRYRLAVGTIKR